MGCLRAASDQAHVEEVECNEYDATQKWTTANRGTSLRNAGMKKCLDAEKGGFKDLFLSDCFLELIRAADDLNFYQNFKIDNGNIKSNDVCVEPPAQTVGG